MAEKGVIEWKIRNFSCWCEAVHGRCIVSPDILFPMYSSTYFQKVELYPRDDNMNVRFCDVSRDFNGELSFIGFDGTPLCSQQIKISKEIPGLFVGLKFENVVAQIGEEGQKDQITLRFCIQCVFHSEQRMCTTIGVLKKSFNIDPKLVENVEPTNILYFRYASERGRGIYLKIARKDEKVHLIMESFNTEIKAVLVEICISMLNSNNDIVRSEVVKHVFIGGERWAFSESLTWTEVEEKGIIIHLRFKIINGEDFERLNYLIMDKMVSMVKNKSVTCPTEQTPSESLVSPNQSDDSVTVLTKELMCLYQDQDFSDLQLKCDNVTFPVHKNILSARSPVFKTMLSSDMREAASNQVDIRDLDPSTLSRFLTYLYTGGVEDLEGESALKLYYAADKYQVPSLKRECTDFLCDNVCMSNVCDVLTLGDRHKDDDLIGVSQNFILNNYNELLGSKEWETFMESEPMLALKTLAYFGKKNYLGKIHEP